MTLVRLACVVGVVSVAVLAMAGCASENGAAEDKDPVESYESELRLSGPRYLGTIANGETKSAYYYDPPRYRAYGFTAQGGDEITIDVTSEYGDAMGWITTSSYDVLAANDDANSSTLDSHVTYTVPDGTPSRSYRIVFRDYDRLDATFDVTLHITSQEPVTCSYGGKTFDAGSSFPSTDRCNTCSCGANGTVYCTKMACVCNPDSEPYRNYLGTAASCATIRYSCTTGWHAFTNACGCGCEQDY